jgi:hypothetical protein
LRSQKDRAKNSLFKELLANLKLVKASRGPLEVGKKGNYLPVSNEQSFEKLSKILQ